MQHWYVWRKRKCYISSRENENRVLQAFYLCYLKSLERNAMPITLFCVSNRANQLRFFYHALHYSALSDLVNVCSLVRRNNVQVLHLIGFLKYFKYINISILPSIYFREERPQKYMVHLEQTWINQYNMHFASFDSRESAQLHSSIIAVQLHPSWEVMDFLWSIQENHAIVTSSGFWTDKRYTVLESFIMLEWSYLTSSIMHLHPGASGDWGGLHLNCSTQQHFLPYGPGTHSGHIQTHKSLLPISHFQ